MHSIASQVGPSRLDIAYDRRGNPADPVVLLIMGLSAQLIHWPEGLVDAMVSRGLQVIRFDNRDSGGSTHLHDAPLPNLPAAMAGDLSSASYTLTDMAADTVGLLDALEVPAAHVVGASMGGAIAQLMALEHPQRVLTLTSIMSTTGDPSVGQSHPETVATIFGGPAASNREEAVERAVRSYAAIQSPGYPTDPSTIARIAGLAYDRDHDRLGIARQAVATVASGDRTQRLKSLVLPTLVIHGSQDTLIDVSGGRATAAAIPGAELLLIEGMGHSLPQGLWGALADAIARLVSASDVEFVPLVDGPKE